MCRGRPPGVSSASTLGGRAVTRLNPPFVSSGGGGRSRVRAGNRAAGRRPRRAGGREGRRPRRPRTLRARARQLPLGSASRAPARRPASPVAAAAAGALRGSSSPTPGVGSVCGEGGREGKICPRSFQVVRWLWTEQRGGSGLCPTSVSPGRRAEVRLGRVWRNVRRLLPYLLFLTEESFLRKPPPPPHLRLRAVICVCYQIHPEMYFPG